MTSIITQIFMEFIIWIQQIQKYRIDKLNVVVLFFLFQRLAKQCKGWCVRAWIFLFSMVYNNILTLLITV